VERDGHWTGAAGNELRIDLRGLSSVFPGNKLSLDFLVTFRRVDGTYPVKGVMRNACHVGELFQCTALFNTLIQCWIRVLRNLYARPFPL